MSKKLKVLIIVGIALLVGVASLLAVLIIGGQSQESQSEFESQAEEMYFEVTDAEITLSESLELVLIGETNATWSSINQEVATVDYNGVVTPKSVGETIIKAEKGSEVAMCRVVVITARTEKLLSLSLNREELVLCQGEDFNLTYEVKYGDEKVDGQVTFTSDNANVTVDKNGKINAVSVGSSVVSATCTYDGKTALKTLSVVVKSDENQLVINVDGFYVIKGNDINLTASVVKGSQVVQESVNATYGVSNGEIAQIDGTLFKGLKKGVTLLSAECEYQGQTLSCEIEMTVREVYTVKFLVDGETYFETQVYDGETLKEITPPQKESHRFLGWFIGKEQFDFSSAIDGDITVKASWQPYDFSSSYYGADVKDLEGNSVVDGTINSVKLGGGIRFKLPLGPENGYLIYLPKINYSNFTFVEYEWAVSAWCFIGPNEGHRDFGQSDYGGNLKITNGGDVLVIEMTYSSGASFTITENSAEIINGTQNLTLSAYTLAENRWFEISAVNCSTEKKPQAVATDGTVCLSASSEKIDDGIKFDLGEGGRVLGWNVELFAVDYSAYKKVVFAFKGGGAWMSIGFSENERIFDSTQDTSPFDGTITVEKNGGKYTVTIKDNVTGNQISKEITDQDVINGEKALTIFVHNGAPYRVFHLGQPECEE